MKRPPAKMPARMLTPLLDYAIDHGVDVARVAREVGVEPSTLQHREGVLSGPKGVRVWEATADALDDPKLGLHVAATVKKDSFDLFTQVAAVSQTVRELLERIERFSRLVSPVPLYEIREHGSDVAMVSRVFAPGQCARALCEFTVCVAWAYTRQWGTGPRITEAWFDHSAPEDLSEHEAFFDAPVRFGAKEAGFRFEGSPLDAKLPAADPGLGAMLERYAEEEIEKHTEPEGLRDRLRAHLVEQLAGGDLGLASSARALAMSERSLQRALDAEGTRFQDELDALRHERALLYMGQRGCTLDEVAFRLGFSSSTAFRRAFKRWTGQSPRDYRAQS